MWSYKANWFLSFELWESIPKTKLSSPHASLAFLIPVMWWRTSSPKLWAHNAYGFWCICGVTFDVPSMDSMIHHKPFQWYTISLFTWVYMVFVYHVKTHHHQIGSYLSFIHRGGLTTRILKQGLDLVKNVYRAVLLACNFVGAMSKPNVLHFYKRVLTRCSHHIHKSK